MIHISDNFLQPPTSRSVVCVSKHWTCKLVKLWVSSTGEVDVWTNGPHWGCAEIVTGFQITRFIKFSLIKHRGFKMESTHNKDAESLFAKLENQTNTMWNTSFAFLKVSTQTLFWLALMSTRHKPLGTGGQKEWPRSVLTCPQMSRCETKWPFHKLIKKRAQKIQTKYISNDLSINLSWRVKRPFSLKNKKTHEFYQCSSSVWQENHL